MTSPPAGYVEVDLFSPEVDDEDDPYVAQFRDLLEEAAEEYQCELLSFEVHRGTVTFSFDSDELTAHILSMLQDHGKGPS